MHDCPGIRTILEIVYGVIASCVLSTADVFLLDLFQTTDSHAEGCLTWRRYRELHLKEQVSLQFQRESRAGRLSPNLGRVLDPVLSSISKFQRAT